MTAPVFNRFIRILLCDDHHIVREGIRSSLADYSFISIVGEAGDGKTTVEQARALSPDVVLMDLNMPVMNGLEATRLITEQCPKTKVIALTVHENHEYVAEVLRSGALGYLLKNTSPDQLVAAIMSVADGDAFFSPSVSRLLLQDYRKTSGDAPKDKLSMRELQVLKLIANGHTNKEVATELKIGTRTVETYRARLMKKLNARTAAELSRIAFQRQLV